MLQVKTKYIVMKKILTYSFLALFLSGSVALLMSIAPPTESTPEPIIEPVENVVEVVNLEVTGLSSYKLEEDSYNFGEVKQNNPAKHIFWFTNTGKEDLKIENVKPSCSCTASNYTKEAIAPGEKGFVEVVYNAKKLGVFRKTATITANTDPRNKVLSISGEVVN